MTRVFVGLGSNLGDRQAYLERALAALRELPDTRLVAVSSFYDSDPVGDPSEPAYLNAVAELMTELSPERLLWNLQLIETRLGRPRSARRGPRTIDLDLLFYDRLVLRQPGLEVPHPRYTERAFVLVPLAELAPAWTDPRTELRMDELLRTSNRASVRPAGPRTVT
jgi:2-amino-4-hydroxy-6-hydroxymethyldihydropteridine diphosphokinase